MKPMKAHRARKRRHEGQRKRGLDGVWWKSEVVFEVSRGEKSERRVRSYFIPGPFPFCLPVWVRKFSTCVCVCVYKCECVCVVLGQILQNTNACFRFTNSYAVCICILWAERNGCHMSWVGKLRGGWKQGGWKIGNGEMGMRACDMYEKYPWAWFECRKRRQSKREIENIAKFREGFQGLLAPHPLHTHTHTLRLVVVHFA